MTSSSAVISKLLPMSILAGLLGPPLQDGRQAIALMGIDVSSTDLSSQLDACLLDDSEVKLGERSWVMLRDPFPVWSAKTHGHECEEHDCRRR